jgi:ActR/RegA family two-component response regulator
MKPILIVEDEAIMRESLQDWLIDIGYEVETVEAGEEALETLATKEFDLAILDMRLPGKNGIEVLKEAKTKSPQLKGIIITAYPSVETAVEAMKYGAVNYLPKPVDLNQMEKLIRETLGPVQVEVRPMPTARKSKVEEDIPAVSEEIPAQPTGEKVAKKGMNGYVFIRIDDAVGPRDFLEIRRKLESIREVISIDDVMDIDWFDTIALVAAPITVQDIACKIAEIPGIASARPSRIIAGPEF